MQTILWLTLSTLIQPSGLPPKLFEPNQPTAFEPMTFTVIGPQADEADTDPNPFTDYQFTAAFTNLNSKTTTVVPGYFAADGDAANSGATKGNKWRCHFMPQEEGSYAYSLQIAKAPGIALRYAKDDERLNIVFTSGGMFGVGKAKDYPKRDFRNDGMLQYVGTRYLQFSRSKRYFLKAGADAPETLLAYQEFDNTIQGNKKAPLKTWQPHIKDWNQGDPTWKNGQGKGLIGAINYMASTGCNAISFLTYNAGGDGDNVWPFTKRDDPMHYDCSKLDQWNIIFDHAQRQGVFLHFKMQENELDDNRIGQKKEQGEVPTALDGGELGPERKLYCRELVARFGHHQALNWNLGEENTQSTQEQIAMAKYIAELDPYKHHIVVHTFPGQQEKVYTALLGKNSPFTGVSLQNSWNQAHARTLKWLNASKNAGKPWAVANDEQNPAHQGVPPDGMIGKQGKATYTIDDIRQQTLWGTLMAGGWGVEYYFGYGFPENDLNLENFRSRAMSWKYAGIALSFFNDEKIPFWEMENADSLLQGQGYCLAKVGEVYIVYLRVGGKASLDLVDGMYDVQWFNPRDGGMMQTGSIKTIKGAKAASLGKAPCDENQDWLVVIKKAIN